MKRTDFSIEDNLIRDWDNNVLILYVSEDKYYDADYKILNGYTGSSLLPVYKSEVNGRTKLVYDVAGKRALSELYMAMSTEMLQDTIDKVADSIDEVGKNGFLKRDNLLIEPEFIFVDEKVVGSDWDEGTAKVNLIYIPYMDTDKIPSKSSINEELKNVEQRLIREHEKHTRALDNKGNEDKRNNRNDVKIVRINEPKELYLVPLDRGAMPVIEMTKELKVIGRVGSRAEIMLNDSSISREHCFLSYKDGEWFIEDMGSKNGTFVNDVQLKEDEKRKLSEGDEVRISKNRFKVARESKQV